ncbi:MAG: hypothetical protein GY769_20590 [bacterium]|nr:hypothetical protein [bacterium]
MTSRRGLDELTDRFGASRRGLDELADRFGASRRGLDELTYRLVPSRGRLDDLTTYDHGLPRDQAILGSATMTAPGAARRYWSWCRSGCHPTRPALMQDQRFEPVDVAVVGEGYGSGPRLSLGRRRPAP